MSHRSEWTANNDLLSNHNNLRGVIMPYTRPTRRDMINAERAEQQKTIRLALVLIALVVVAVIMGR